MPLTTWLTSRAQPQGDEADGIVYHKGSNVVQLPSEGSIVAESANIFDVSEADFPTAVLERSRQMPVVVDFWAPWCGPCRTLAPILERLVNERDGQVLLAKVNIDDAQGLAAQYGVESIPHVVAFRDGRPLVDFVGLLPEVQLREFLDRLSPSETDRLVQQGLALETTNPAEAESLLRQVLAKDRHRETAILALTRLLIAQDKDSEARGYLEDLGPGSVHADEVERLNGLLGIRDAARSLSSASDVRQRLHASPQDPQVLLDYGVLLAAEAKYKDALEQLLAAGQRSMPLAQTKVRETMVNIFRIIGVRDPLADDFRQKLSMLLY